MTRPLTFSLLVMALLAWAVVAAELRQQESTADRPAASSEASGSPRKTKKAYFAAGCFWGVEHSFESVDGVLAARSGFMGGRSERPTYRDVCGGDTRHAEAVEVEYDPGKVDYETLAKLFFELHNPSYQAPREGDQYRSAVFTVDAAQKETISQLIRLLRDKGMTVHTEVSDAGTFWLAEEYHQDYYRKQGREPTCHRIRKLFDE